MKGAGSIFEGVSLTIEQRCEAHITMWDTFQQLGSGKRSTKIK